MTAPQRVCSNRHRSARFLGAECTLEYPQRSFLLLVHLCLFLLNSVLGEGKRFQPILLLLLVPADILPMYIRFPNTSVLLCPFLQSSLSLLSALFPGVTQKLDILVYQVLLRMWSSMFPRCIKHRVYVSLEACIA